jgi:hypothetical protein
MMKWVIASLAFFLIAGTGAKAATLCACCGSATSQVCEQPCSSVSSFPNQCQVILRNDAIPGDQAEANLLYDISIQRLKLEPGDLAAQETVRRILENARLAAESDRRQVVNSLNQKTINQDEAERLASRYRRAMVNYYLGMINLRGLRSQKLTPD